MPALLFEAGGQRYGLDVSHIIEILPAVPLRGLAGVPYYVAGLLRYRGAVVPVLDISRLLGGASAVSRLSTRLVIVRYKIPGTPGIPGAPAAGERVLGLLVEH